MEGGGIWERRAPLPLSLPPNSSFLLPNLPQPPAVKVHVSLTRRVLTRVSPSSGLFLRVASEERAEDWRQKFVSMAHFPPPRFYAHFGLLHRKGVMEMPKSGKKKI